MYRIFFKSVLLLLFLGGAPLEARPFGKRYSCEIFQLARPDLDNGEVAFINGMNHRPPRAVRCGAVLSKLGKDCNIYVVYNPTNGFFRDLHNCFVELFKFQITPPIRKLHEKWDMFFEESTEAEFFLQFCHSQGAIQVRNALLAYPPDRRKRIIVVAIAPAAYIDQELCANVYHYVSRRDIVPTIDKKGRERCRDTIVLLTPHHRAAFFDHHFLSPTFRDVINYHINDYIETCRGEC